MTASVGSRLERLLPFLAWRHTWSGQSVRSDVIAGVTVALVAIPQALAYAQLAGLPPHMGLYAALLPAVVGALFGSCGPLSTGPVALTALLTGASLIPFAGSGTPEFVTLAILLALLSGLIQLVLGLLRAGWLLNLLSRPVLSGFLNAAALIIAMSQVPAMLGLPAARTSHFLVAFWHTLQNVAAMHVASALFGLGAVTALLLLKRFAPRLPGVLLVVSAATVLSAATGFAEHGGAVVGAIPLGLPTLSLPDFEWNVAVALVPAAFVIALVSFMEVTSSAKLISARTNLRWNQNQELVGQGLAKLAAAATGTMPVSASLSRSALNFASGARTGLATLVCASAVLLTLLYFTPLLWHLPTAVLAAVILLVVTGLLDFGSLRCAWQASRHDGVAAAATFAATLLFAPNIQNGILTGLLLSLALMLYRDMRPRTALLGLHPDGTYRDLERFDLPHPHPELVILRFDSPLTFVTAATFENAVARAASAQPNVRTVLVSAAGINVIDDTGLHAITTALDRLRVGGQSLAFCGLKKQIIDAMERTGLWRRLGDAAAYRTEHQAVEALVGQLQSAVAT